MTDDMGNAELIRTVESHLSEEAAKIFRNALEANEFRALWALGGLSEAYAKQERAISAGYRRWRSS
ncbi:hypothetical protein [Aureimonas ureilytica]|uniref:hypothetical protein n=1 Tax=Aureimonas ureilytica TaxID=401562 RepID=UPI000370BE32|nr:hypothetical protein [Aureimonas ureilytica]